MMLGPDMPAGPRLRIAGRGGEKTVKLIVLMSFFNSIIICLRHRSSKRGQAVLLHYLWPNDAMYTGEKSVPKNG